MSCTVLTAIPVNCYSIFPVAQVRNLPQPWLFSLETHIQPILLSIHLKYVENLTPSHHVRFCHLGPSHFFHSDGITQQLLFFVCFLFFSFIPSFWPRLQHVGLRLNPGHSNDPSPSSDNAGSLTCCATREFLQQYLKGSSCSTSVPAEGSFHLPPEWSFWN